MYALLLVRCTYVYGDLLGRHLLDMMGHHDQEPVTLSNGAVEETFEGQQTRSCDAANGVNNGDGGTNGGGQVAVIVYSVVEPNHLCIWVSQRQNDDDACNDTDDQSDDDSSDGSDEDYTGGWEMLEFVRLDMTKALQQIGATSLANLVCMAREGLGSASMSHRQARDWLIEEM